MTTATKPPANMDAMTYWKWYGKPHCERLAASAGTSYSYWKHICNGTKSPGLDLALALVKASNGELSLEKLLPPERITGIKQAMKEISTKQAA